MPKLKNRRWHGQKLFRIFCVATDQATIDNHDEAILATDLLAPLVIAEVPEVASTVDIALSVNGLPATMPASDSVGRVVLRQLMKPIIDLKTPLQFLKKSPADFHGEKYAAKMGRGFLQKPGRVFGSKKTQAKTSWVPAKIRMKPTIALSSS